MLICQFPCGSVAIRHGSLLCFAAANQVRSALRVAISDLRLPALFLCQAHISPHCVAAACPFDSRRCPSSAGLIRSEIYRYLANHCCHLTNHCRYLSEHCCSVPFLSDSIPSLCASIRHVSLPFSVHGCSVLLRASPSLSISLRRKARPLLMLLLQKSRALFKRFAIFLCAERSECFNQYDTGHLFALPSHIISALVTASPSLSDVSFTQRFAGCNSYPCVSLSRSVQLRCQSLLGGAIPFLRYSELSHRYRIGSKRCRL